MDKKREERCIFCGGQQSGEGIRVLHALICFSCEREIAALAGGGEKYDFYCRRIKQFWDDLPAAAEAEGTYGGEQGHKAPKAGDMR